MEHKLITGGEQYLPFARSRIKALRATGLKYASQQYEIDGCSVKVRIEPGHEYVELSGGAVSLAMDSGVFEVGSIAEMNTGTYLPGTMHEVGAASAYDAPFVVDPSDAVGRTNPGIRSVGQFAGKLTKSRYFKGRILPQQAFAPGEIPSDPATNPATTVADPHDTLLWFKKTTSILCPASIFTGRCRLYVQAMYGLPLYEYGKDGGVKKVNSPLSVESRTTAAPELWLPSYVSKDDFVADPYGEKRPAVYPDILLSTSCGVWLDESDGKHWLFKIHDGAIDVYPLKSSPAGEGLRHFLIPGTGTDALSVEDRKHLESYILAYSLPDCKNKQNAGVAATGGTYSMGYGWHWSYSGGTADIVINNGYMQDLYREGMESTHYRVTITKKPIPTPQGGFALGDMRQTWEGVLSVIEGPSRWAVPRDQITVVEPDFLAGNLAKTTPPTSWPVVGSAPVYAFYIGDDLKLLRVDTTFTPPKSTVREMSPGFASNPSAFTSIEYNTAGLGGGFLRDHYDTAGFYTFTFTCGGISSGQIKVGDTKHLSTYTVSDKAFVSWGTGYGTGSYGYRSFTVGTYPEYSTVYITGYLATDRQAANVTYSIETTDERFESQGMIEVIVPAYDSEAVYIRGIQTELHTSTGTRNTYAGGGFGYRSTTTDGMGVTNGEFVYYSLEPSGATHHGAPTSSSPVSSSTTTVKSLKEGAVCHSGAVPAVFTHLNEFHSNTLESVGTNYYTVSGTSTIHPVVYAPGHITSVGMGTAAPVAAVITGWM